MPLDVPGVDHEQAERDEELRPRRRNRQEHGRGDGQPVGDDERAHVGAQDGRVDGHDVAGLAPSRLEQHRDPRHKHREGREHEWRTEDRPDADLVRVCLAGEQDRDDRDHGLGQRRSDRREDRADGALGQPELVPEPLDAVGEQLGADQDDHERHAQDQQVHRT